VPPPTLPPPKASPDAALDEAALTELDAQAILAAAGCSRAANLRSIAAILDTEAKGFISSTMRALLARSGARAVTRDAWERFAWITAARKAVQKGGEVPPPISHPKWSEILGKPLRPGSKRGPSALQLRVSAADLAAVTAARGSSQTLLFPQAPAVASKLPWEGPLPWVDAPDAQAAHPVLRDPAALCAWARVPEFAPSLLSLTRMAPDTPVSTAAALLADAAGAMLPLRHPILSRSEGPPRGAVSEVGSRPPRTNSAGGTASFPPSALLEPQPAPHAPSRAHAVTGTSGGRPPANAFTRQAVRLATALQVASEAVEDTGRPLESTRLDEELWDWVDHPWYRITLRQLFPQVKTPSAPPDQKRQSHSRLFPAFPVPPAPVANAFSSAAWFSESGHMPMLVATLWRQQQVLAAGVGLSSDALSMLVTLVCNAVDRVLAAWAATATDLPWLAPVHKRISSSGQTEWAAQALSGFQSGSLNGPILAMLAVSRGLPPHTAATVLQITTRRRVHRARLQQARQRDKGKRDRPAVAGSTSRRARRTVSVNLATDPEPIALLDGAKSLVQSFGESNSLLHGLPWSTSAVIPALEAARKSVMPKPGATHRSNVSQPGSNPLQSRASQGIVARAASASEIPSQLPLSGAGVPSPVLSQRRGIVRGFRVRALSSTGTRSTLPRNRIAVLDDYVDRDSTKPRQGLSSIVVHDRKTAAAIARASRASLRGNAIRSRSVEMGAADSSAISPRTGRDEWSLASRKLPELHLPSPDHRGSPEPLRDADELASEDSSPSRSGLRLPSLAATESVNPDHECIEETIRGALGAEGKAWVFPRKQDSNLPLEPTKSGTKPASSKKSVRFETLHPIARDMSEVIASTVVAVASDVLQTAKVIAREEDCDIMGVRHIAAAVDRKQTLRQLFAGAVHLSLSSRSGPCQSAVRQVVMPLAQLAVAVPPRGRILRQDLILRLYRDARALVGVTQSASHPQLPVLQQAMSSLTSVIGALERSVLGNLVEEYSVGWGKWIGSAWGDGSYSSARHRGPNAAQPGVLEMVDSEDAPSPFMASHAPMRHARSRIQSLTTIQGGEPEAWLYGLWRLTRKVAVTMDTQIDPNALNMCLQFFLAHAVQGVAVASASAAVDLASTLAAVGSISHAHAVAFGPRNLPGPSPPLLPDAEAMEARLAPEDKGIAARARRPSALLASQQPKLDATMPSPAIKPVDSSGRGVKRAAPVPSPLRGPIKMEAAEPTLPGPKLPSLGHIPRQVARLSLLPDAWGQEALHAGRRTRLGSLSAATAFSSTTNPGAFLGIVTHTGAGEWWNEHARTLWWAETQAGNSAHKAKRVVAIAKAAASKGKPVAVFGAQDADAFVAPALPFPTISRFNSEPVPAVPFTSRVPGMRHFPFLPDPAPPLTPDWSRALDAHGRSNSLVEENAYSVVSLQPVGGPPPPTVSHRSSGLLGGFTIREATLNSSALSSANSQAGAPSLLGRKRASSHVSSVFGVDIDSADAFQLGLGQFPTMDPFVLSLQTTFTPQSSTSPLSFPQPDQSSGASPRSESVDFTSPTANSPPRRMSNDQSKPVRVQSSTIGSVPSDAPGFRPSRQASAGPELRRNVSDPAGHEVSSSSMVQWEQVFRSTAHVAPSSVAGSVGHRRKKREFVRFLPNPDPWTHSLHDLMETAAVHAMLQARDAWQRVSVALLAGHPLTQGAIMSLGISPSGSGHIGVDSGWESPISTDEHPDRFFDPQSGSSSGSDTDALPEKDVTQWIGKDESVPFMDEQQSTMHRRLKRVVSLLQGEEEETEAPDVFPWQGPQGSSLSAAAERAEALAVFCAEAASSPSSISDGLPDHDDVASAKDPWKVSDAYVLGASWSSSRKLAPLSPSATSSHEGSMHDTAEESPMDASPSEAASRPRHIRPPPVWGAREGPGGMFSILNIAHPTPNSGAIAASVAAGERRRLRVEGFRRKRSMSRSSSFLKPLRSTSQQRPSRGEQPISEIGQGGVQRRSLNPTDTTAEPPDRARSVDRRRMSDSAIAPPSMILSVRVPVVGPMAPEDPSPGTSLYSGVVTPSAASVVSYALSSAKADIDSSSTSLWARKLPPLSPYQPAHRIPPGYDASMIRTMSSETLTEASSDESDADSNAKNSDQDDSSDDEEVAQVLSGAATPGGTGRMSSPKARVQSKPPMRRPRRGTGSGNSLIRARREAATKAQDDSTITKRVSASSRSTLVSSSARLGGPHSLQVNPLLLTSLGMAGVQRLQAAVNGLPHDLNIDPSHPAAALLLAVVGSVDVSAVLRWLVTHPGAESRTNPQASPPDSAVTVSPPKHPALIAIITQEKHLTKSGSASDLLQKHRPARMTPIKVVPDLVGQSSDLSSSPTSSFDNTAESSPIGEVGYRVISSKGRSSVKASPDVGPHRAHRPRSSTMEDNPLPETLGYIRQHSVSPPTGPSSSLAPGEPSQIRRSVSADSGYSPVRDNPPEAVEVGLQQPHSSDSSATDKPPVLPFPAAPDLRIRAPEGQALPPTKPQDLELPFVAQPILRTSWSRHQDESWAKRVEEGVAMQAQAGMLDESDEDADSYGSSADSLRGSTSNILFDADQPVRSFEQLSQLFAPRDPPDAVGRHPSDTITAPRSSVKSPVTQSSSSSGHHNTSVPRKASATDTIGSMELELVLPERHVPAASDPQAKSPLPELAKPVTRSNSDHRRELLWNSLTSRNSPRQRTTSKEFIDISPRVEQPPSAGRQDATTPSSRRRRHSLTGATSPLPLFLSSNEGPVDSPGSDSRVPAGTDQTLSSVSDSVHPQTATHSSEQGKNSSTRDSQRPRMPKRHTPSGTGVSYTVSSTGDSVGFSGRHSTASFLDATTPVGLQLLPDTPMPQVVGANSQAKASPWSRPLTPSNPNPHSPALSTWPPTEKDSVPQGRAVSRPPPVQVESPQRAPPDLASFPSGPVESAPASEGSVSQNDSDALPRGLESLATTQMMEKPLREAAYYLDRIICRSLRLPAWAEACSSELNTGPGQNPTNRFIREALAASGPGGLAASIARDDAAYCMWEAAFSSGRPPMLRSLTDPVAPEPPPLEIATPVLAEAEGPPPRKRRVGFAVADGAEEAEDSPHEVLPKTPIGVMRSASLTAKKLVPPPAHKRSKLPHLDVNADIPLSAIPHLKAASMLPPPARYALFRTVRIAERMGASRAVITSAETGLMLPKSLFSKRVIRPVCRRLGFTPSRRAQGLIQVSAEHSASVILRLARMLSAHGAAQTTRQLLAGDIRLTIALRCPANQFPDALAPPTFMRESVDAVEPSLYNPSTHIAPAESILMHETTKHRARALARDWAKARAVCADLPELLSTRELLRFEPPRPESVVSISHAHPENPIDDAFASLEPMAAWGSPQGAVALLSCPLPFTTLDELSLVAVDAVLDHPQHYAATRQNERLGPEHSTKPTQQDPTPPRTESARGPPLSIKPPTKAPGLSIAAPGKSAAISAASTKPTGLTISKPGSEGRPASLSISAPGGSKAPTLGLKIRPAEPTALPPRRTARAFTDTNILLDADVDSGSNLTEDTLQEDQQRDEFGLPTTHEDGTATSSSEEDNVVWTTDAPVPSHCIKLVLSAHDHGQVSSHTEARGEDAWLESGFLVESFSSSDDHALDSKDSDMEPGLERTYSIASDADSDVPDNTSSWAESASGLFLERAAEEAGQWNAGEAWSQDDEDWEATNVSARPARVRLDSAESESAPVQIPVESVQVVMDLPPPERLLEEWADACCGDALVGMVRGGCQGFQAAVDLHKRSPCWSLRWSRLSVLPEYASVCGVGPLVCDPMRFRSVIGHVSATVCRMRHGESAQMTALAGLPPTEGVCGEMSSLLMFSACQAAHSASVSGRQLAAEMKAMARRSAPERKGSRLRHSAEDLFEGLEGDKPMDGLDALTGREELSSSSLGLPEPVRLGLLAVEAAPEGIELLLSGPAMAALMALLESRLVTIVRRGLWIAQHQGRASAAVSADDVILTPAALELACMLGLQDHLESDVEGRWRRGSADPLGF
jgi:hypothetical protein